MFIFIHHTYSINFIAFHNTNGFSNIKDRTKILSKVRYPGPNKKKYDNAKKTSIVLSFIRWTMTSCSVFHFAKKDHERILKKKKKNQYGVGQGPSNGQVS